MSTAYHPQSDGQTEKDVTAIMASDVTAIRARGSVSGSRRTTEALMAEYILTRELSPGEFPSVSSVCVCRRASVGKNGARDLTCCYYFELTYIWRRTACHVTILLTATVPFLCHVRSQAD